MPARFRFDPATLERAYRKLQTEVHPDRFAAGTDQEKRVALQSSARVNEAYRALKDPVERARYLLQLHGIDALAETDTQLPLAFLERQLERREVAAEAVADQDSRALAAVIADVRAGRRRSRGRVSRIRSTPNRPTPPRARAFASSFLAKLVDDLDALQGALDD